jgi:fumarylacetoacetase
MIDHTHDPELKSWVESANDPATDFPIQNLPFATFRRNGENHSRPRVAIGNQILLVKTRSSGSITGSPPIN